MPLFPILIQLVVFLLVAWVFWWLIGYLGLPEPINKVVVVVFVLVCLVLLYYTFGGIFMSGPGLAWRLR